MKKTILTFMTGILMTSAAYAGAIYSKTVYMDDVSVGTWTPVTNVACYTTNGMGTYTQDVHTFYYRITGYDNIKNARLTPSSAVTTNWTGDKVSNNTVIIRWDPREGVNRYAVERTEDGVNWTNWTYTTAFVTNFTDNGTNTAWTNSIFTNLMSFYPAPVMPWTGAGGASSDSTNYFRNFANQTNVPAFLLSETDPGFNAWRTDVGSYTIGPDSTAVGGGIAFAPWANGSDLGVALGNGSDARQHGVAVGYFAAGTNFGTALGSGAQGHEKGVGVGLSSVGNGTGNVAVGYSASVGGISFWDTSEIGRGTATNNGWFHYRGTALFDPIGNLTSPTGHFASLYMNGTVLGTAATNMTGNFVSSTGGTYTGHYWGFYSSDETFGNNGMLLLENYLDLNIGIRHYNFTSNGLSLSENMTYWGGGSGLTNLNAGAIASGTLNLARLPAVVVTNNGSATITNLTITSAGDNVGSNINLNGRILAGSPQQVFDPEGPYHQVWCGSNFSTYAIAFKGWSSNGMEWYMQNLSTDANAYAELNFYSFDDASHSKFAGIGINGGNYSNVTYLGGTNDLYVGASGMGNVLLYNGGTTNNIRMWVGGTNGTTNTAILITSTDTTISNLTVIGTLTAAYETNTSAAFNTGTGSVLQVNTSVTTPYSTSTVAAINVGTAGTFVVNTKLQSSYATNTLTAMNTGTAGTFVVGYGTGTVWGFNTGTGSVFVATTSVTTPYSTNTLLTWNKGTGAVLQVNTSITTPYATNTVLDFNVATGKNLTINGTLTYSTMSSTVFSANTFTGNTAIINGTLQVAGGITNSTAASTNYMAGRLGVGTNALPYSSLYIVGTNGPTISNPTSAGYKSATAVIENNANASLMFVTPDANQASISFVTNGAAGSAGYILWSNASTSMAFATANTARMTLDANGNVLVNKATSGSYGGIVPKMEINGTSITNTDQDGGTLALFGTNYCSKDLGAGLTLGGAYSSTTVASGGRVRVAKENVTDGDYAFYMAFDTRANGGTLTEKMRISSAGVISGNASGMTNFPSSFTPYMVAYASSNLLNPTNGNFQFYQPSGTTTNFLPYPVATNSMYSIRLDVFPGGQSYTIFTNGVYFGTNEVMGANATDIKFHSGTTTLLFDKPWGTNCWRCFGL